VGADHRRILERTTIEKIWMRRKLHPRDCARPTERADQRTSPTRKNTTMKQIDVAWDFFFGKYLK
jgi:hypothetical protein